jgi:hypothetical protein
LATTRCNPVCHLSAGGFIAANSIEELRKERDVAKRVGADAIDYSVRNKIISTSGGWTVGYLPA